MGLLEREIQLGSVNSPRVVWVLNTFANIGILSEKFGFSCFPLHAETTAKVRWLLRGAKPDDYSPAFALSGFSSKATPVAFLEQRGLGRIPVAASCDFGRLLCVPATETPLRYATIRSVLSLSQNQFRLLLLVLVMVLVAGLFALYNRAHAQYERSREELAEDISFQRSQVPLTSNHWAGAEARLAQRIVINELGSIVPKAGSLRHYASPYVLWLQDRADPDAAQVYFNIAVLAGDLSSARQIVRGAVDSPDVAFNLEEGVFRLWQTAVESLHELDFDKAAAYGSLFVELANVLSRSQGGEYDGIGRNRTVARILVRAFADRSLLSLCSQPDMGRSFGRLLGGDTGERLPGGNPTGLKERRLTNSKKNCIDRSRTDTQVNWEADLINLELIAGEHTLGEDQHVDQIKVDPSVCRRFPIECAYAAVRDGWREEGATPKVAREAFSFASKCTYLSDDAVGLLLRERLFSPPEIDYRADTPANPNEVISALNCVANNDSDFAGLIYDRLTQLDCRLVNWHIAIDTKGLDPESFAGKLVARCNHGSAS